MKRRGFISISLSSLWSLLFGQAFAQEQIPRNKVMTVNGWISKKQMGVTLPHEHIVVDFIGADKIDVSTYNLDKIYETALPILQKLKENGCTTFIDCTPNYLGRVPSLLKKLSQATGIHILTNTGYYGAVNHKYLPSHVEIETPQQLAMRWVKEWEEGIEGTGIRPSFMKISVGDAPITDLQKKIVAAAALTHLQTGLTIGSHTGGNGAVLEQLAIIENRGVQPSAFVWIHAQNEKNKEIHLQVARKGAWVEFDGLYPHNFKLSEETKNEYLNYLDMMKREKLLHRTLISQDSGWYHIGEANGGNYLPYHLIFTDFLPRLYEMGFTKNEVNLLIQENPYQAFAVRIRKK
ncbi:MAG: phosphotriesterase [Thermoflexibacter sp.]|nr:phosphotriesterase [Thermoflexibacter sp.]